MKTKSKDVEKEMQVVTLQTGRVSFCLLGTAPMIYNSVSMKAKEALLNGDEKKNAAERAGSLKHEPYHEYVASTYRHRDDTHPTRLMVPAGMFKGAMKSAAVRMPGLKRTEISQLVWCEGRDIDVYGVPQIYLSVVRSADIARTPDVRTRAIVPQWCAQISVTYVKPQLSDKAIVNLVAAAGLLAGIGDGKQERGYGHGTFEIVAENDARFQNIMKAGGRAAQDAALKNPTAYDIETEELLQLHEAAAAKRGDSITRKKAA